MTALATSQPETGVYDTLIGEWLTTTPATGGRGGPMNDPLLGLANRTGYLKAHLDALEAAGLLLAPLASPAFSGNPTAPTPPLGDNDLSIATTAFVQATVGGLLTKSVAGGSNVSLSAVEAGNGLLVFTGALTADIAVILPSIPTRSWIVKNATTGLHTLTVKHGSGSGVAVTQGTVAEVWSDGNDVFPATTDYPSIAMTGTPPAPNPATGNRSQQVATMQKFADEFAKVLNAHGYQKLPSGLIIQWGVTPLINANGQLAVALPVAFPTANLCAVCMAEYSAAPDAAYMVSIFGRTTTNMSFYNANTTTQIKATYIALGY